jgi:hypothetical protein
MKSRYALFRRGEVFYCQDTTTGQQTSLRTKDEAEAHTLLHSRNEAHRAPTVSLQIARTYPLPRLRSTNHTCVHQRVR